MKTFKHFDEISQRFTIANNVDNKIVSQKYQVISLQGKRPYNEDRYIVKTTANGTFKRKVSLSLDTQPYDLYCIFDGHGGTACANFLRDHFEKYLDIFYQANGDPKSALFSTFARCESEFLAQC